MDGYEAVKNINIRIKNINLSAVSPSWICTFSCYNSMHYYLIKFGDAENFKTLFYHGYSNKQMLVLIMDLCTLTFMKAR